MHAQEKSTGKSQEVTIQGSTNISDEDIINVNIPTGSPLVYEFDDSFNAIKHYYLGDQEALKAKIEEVGGVVEIK